MPVCASCSWEGFQNTDFGQSSRRNCTPVLGPPLCLPSASFKLQPEGANVDPGLIHPCLLIWGCSPPKVVRIPTKTRDTPIVVNRGLLIRGQHYPQKKNNNNTYQSQDPSTLLPFEFWGRGTPLLKKATEKIGYQLILSWVWLKIKKGGLTQVLVRVSTHQAKPF